MSDKKEIAKRMQESFIRYYKLAKLSDKALGYMLMDIWEDMELFTPKSDLLQVVIDRLHGEEDARC